MSSVLFCKRCNLQFGKKYVFDLHLSLVHGEKMEIENEQSKYREDFQETQISGKIISDHVLDTSLKCDKCSSVFKTKGNLKRHIESVHEGKKPFKCNICDSSFSRNTHLNAHIASVHEGKKPFKCNICDASFTQRKNLNGHIASVHEGKRSFKCNICDASFK